MTKFILSMLLSIFSVQVFAQGLNPIKFDSYNESETEDLKVLEDKARLFAAELNKAPISTRGVIIFYAAVGERNVNFCSKEKLTAEKRSDFVRKVLTEKSNVSSKRILAIDGYIRANTELDFWLVPESAKDPKPTSNAYLDCFCAGISVNGPVEAFNRKETLVFTASVSGGDGSTPIKYRWSVSSGSIVYGQGTPSINVMLNRTKATEISATVVVEGANGSCKDCIEKASFTTKLLSR
jgi:hypothetical protein